MLSHTNTHTHKYTHRKAILGEKISFQDVILLVFYQELLVHLSSQVTQLQHFGKKSASEVSSSRKKLKVRSKPKKLKAALAAIQRKKFDRTARKTFLAKNGELASSQPSIARDFEREFKAASRGTVESLTMFHRVCKGGGQWQACTNGLFFFYCRIRFLLLFCLATGVLRQLSGKPNGHPKK